MVNKQTRNPAKDVINLDLIKLNLPSRLLIYVIKATFLKKKVLIINNQEFLRNHIINFFKYVTQYNADISVILRDVFNKNKAKYNDYLILDGNIVISDKDQIINPKELKTEKKIVKRFLSTPDLGESFIFLRNDIYKSSLNYGWTLEEWKFLERKEKEKREKEKERQETWKKEREESNKLRRERLSKKLTTIDKLIQEQQFSTAIKNLKHIIDEAKPSDLSEILNQAREMLRLCNAKARDLKKPVIEKKFAIIENLIQEKNFSDAIKGLNEIIIEAKSYNLEETLKKAQEKLKYCKKLERITLIKKTVLDLGIKFVKLQIIEISEVCSIKNEQLIIATVNEMIKNKEIYAQYFSSTKSVAFDQQANIDEIDSLMKAYKEWEDKKVKKK